MLSREVDYSHDNGELFGGRLPIQHHTSMSQAEVPPERQCSGMVGRQDRLTVRLEGITQPFPPHRP
jgi:hypothetical protein